MMSCCSPIARDPSYKLLNGRELPSASKTETSPASSRACWDGVLAGLGTVTPPHDEAVEQTLLRLNRKLDEKLILLLCEFLEAVSRGEAVDPDESECMEPKDGESPPFSNRGLLLSTGHDIDTSDILCFAFPLKSCMLDGESEGMERGGNSQNSRE
jgi:hypothetical protein